MQVDRNRRPRIKRKRQPTDGHVRPAEGKEARAARRAAQKEAQQGGFPLLRWRRSSLPAQEAIPMLPREASPGARGTKRRRARQEPARPAERVRPIGVIWISWRWVSGIMSFFLLLVLAGLFLSDLFYVNAISVGGVQYLTREEVFRFSGVSQKHIFWIDPAAVQERLEANNNIAAAEVRVGWPPNMVQIVVQERDPVLTWEQGNDRVWVDINGMVMFQREDRPDLLRVVFNPNVPLPPEPIGTSSYIDPEIVRGAMLLKSRLPRIDVLLYDPQKGLGWRDPKNWIVWFGRGDDMAMKALVYEAIVAEYNEAIQFSEVDVSDPDHPVFKILYRKQE